MRGVSATTLLTAALAAFLWLGIGTVQRTQGGAPLPAALVAELPLTAVVFVVALVLTVWRRR
ncbi:hypothetical protein [Deinococcus hopiensis]|uniref:Uncharacterized protein n=1 Tax=Deinococcus hopiensis KR-140 TaxID=695939 RepID=A0A1W1V641_9DEIO|nr:hypothetical protein [Deinococcus hopiensis]SMB88531.1 hypothetical protein SAMN00790413_00088 [Deinococcus hopiensis KR-140]